MGVHVEGRGGALTPPPAPPAPHRGDPDDEEMDDLSPTREEGAVRDRSAATADPSSSAAPTGASGGAVSANPTQRTAGLSPAPPVDAPTPAVAAQGAAISLDEYGSNMEPSGRWPLSLAAVERLRDLAKGFDIATAHLMSTTGPSSPLEDSSILDSGEDTAKVMEGEASSDIESDGHGDDSELLDPVDVETAEP